MKNYLLVLLLTLYGNNITADIQSFALSAASNYTFSYFYNYGPNTKKYKKLISKIYDDKYVYYDLLKANPRSSYIPSTPCKEFKGIGYARQVEKLANQNFNEYATITKDGCFFCLTKDDLRIIQGLYEKWIDQHLERNDTSFVSTALDSTIYHWAIPF